MAAGGLYRASRAAVTHDELPAILGLIALAAILAWLV